MLDFSWAHILLVLVVALVVVGPKDLPRLMRTVGQWMGKARSMADEFRKSFDDMARQSELDELRKEIENLRKDRPFADIEKELNDSIIPGDMKSAAGTTAEIVEVENPPPPRSGELDPAPPDGAPAGMPEPLAADGYEPPPP